MRLLFRLSGFSTLFICVLECIEALSLHNDTSSKNTLYKTDSVKKNVVIRHINSLAVNARGLSKNETEVIINSTINKQIPANEFTKQPKKHPRRKFKKKRKQKGLAQVIQRTEPSVVNQTEVNQTIKKKRKRKFRRRKNRKNQRKSNLDNSNILEVTTAKEIIFPKNTNSSSTINELIRKLNENPEHNFDEFRMMHSDERRMDKSKRKNIGNLVAPLPSNSKFITGLQNNITLHVNMGNSSYNKIPNRRNNRCRKNKGGCTHLCNPKGRSKCSCLKGFGLAVDQKTCLDINECDTNNGGCQKNCHNSLGSYECRCPVGLRLADDLKSCDDINECLLRNGHGPCQDTCDNVFGSFKCSCEGLNGTLLGDDGHSCIDINECVSDNGGCSHQCINTFGKVFCSCPDGMELSSDWKTCQDINECEDDTIKSSCKNCINTEGSYSCMDSLPDYQNDEPTIKITCKPLPLPPLGFISCSRDEAQKFYFKLGRKRTINSPGTVCKLMCPTGHKLVGQFFVACNSSGNWEGETDAKCMAVEPPTLVCPPTQVFKAEEISERVFVKFPSPKTNINWRYIKSYPSWGKDLNRVLKVGQYDLNFIVRDPNSKLSASCTFKIVVNY